MRTDEMCHEIDRLEVALKNSQKQEDAWRVEYRKCKVKLDAAEGALHEILWLPPGSNDHYVIAGNALGQSRDRHPAEGEQTRPATEREACVTEIRTSANNPANHYPDQYKAGMLNAAALLAFNGKMGSS